MDVNSRKQSSFLLHFKKMLSLWKLLYKNNCTNKQIGSVNLKKIILVIKLWHRSTMTRPYLRNSALKLNPGWPGWSAQNVTVCNLPTNKLLKQIFTHIFKLSSKRLTFQCSCTLHEHTRVQSLYPVCVVTRQVGFACWTFYLDSLQKQQI